MLNTKFNENAKPDENKQGALSNALLVLAEESPTAPLVSPPQAGNPLLVLAENGFLEDSVVDGPGLRCVVFVQGCPHACEGCHNPSTHAFSGGQKASLAQLYQSIKSSPLCSGVTFSGGEPFCQSAPLAQLAAMLKKGGYNIAAYSGYTFEELLHGSKEQTQLLAQLDILVDRPYVAAQRSEGLRFRGSANQRILNVPKSLAAGAAVWCEDEGWVGNA